MKILKQPWFVILVIIVSIYSWQFYKKPKSVEISVNSANAVETVKSKKSVKDEEEKKAPIEVKVSQSFRAQKVKKLVLSSPRFLKVKVQPTTGNEILISLIGEGNYYSEDGKKLANWFNITQKSGRLELAPFAQTKSKDFTSLKRLAKAMTGDDSENMTMIIEVPEEHEFELVNLELVAGSFVGEGLLFKKMVNTIVSADIKLKDSRGETLKIESVSGDTDLTVRGLKTISVETVSGDTKLTLENTNPQIDYESISGDLVVNLPQESQLDVDFSSMTGELKNDFGVSAKATSRVSFSSMSGDVEINKIVR